MARLSIVCLSLSGEESEAAAAIHEAAASMEMGCNVVAGPYDELLEAVASWTILPEIVLAEVPGDRGAGEVVRDLGARFPEGEAEMILFGAPNDITVYRTLKHDGVREIFSGVPGADQLCETLEDINRDNLRRTGIDPRRAVYVWSACGGAGGTSLATSMARKFASEGRRTLFIDLDTATGPASFMFNAERGARETSGLVDALSNSDRIDALFLERAIDVAGDNLFYLSARRRGSDPEPNAAAIPVLIARAQQNFDMVIVDVPWRCAPEPDMNHVQGHSYIVAPPNPAGLLGFSVLMKDIDSAPGKAPVYGVINRAGEFRANDITKSIFKEAGDISLFQIPYDASAAGRMFFEQKTFLDLGGKIRKAVDRVMKTLPGKAVEGATQAERRIPSQRRGRKKRRLFGR